MERIPAKEKFSTDPNKPIAVVYGWLLAKSRHLEKFGHFYNDYGADVFTVKPTVSEVSILHSVWAKSVIDIFSCSETHARSPKTGLPY